LPCLHIQCQAVYEQVLVYPEEEEEEEEEEEGTTILRNFGNYLPVDQA
jgi:hypothetical protein